MKKIIIQFYNTIVKFISFLSKGHFDFTEHFFLNDLLFIILFLE